MAEESVDHGFNELAHRVGEGKKDYAEIHGVDLTGNPIKRMLWITVGMIFVGLGILGTILPGVPTTSFMVVAAACFARSSRRLYNQLLNNRIIGHYICDFREGKGMPLHAKIITCGMISFFAILSIVMIARAGDPGFGQMVVFLAGAGGLYYVGWKVPTAGPHDGAAMAKVVP